MTTASSVWVRSPFFFLMACQGFLKELCQLPILDGIKVAGNFEG